MNENLNNNTGQVNQQNNMVQNQISEQPGVNVTPQTAVQPPVAENVAQNNTPKKSNSKLIIIIVAIVAVIGLGLGAFFLFGKGGNKINNNNPENVAKSYVKAAISKDYTTAFSLIYLPEGAFVTTNDYSNYIQNKDFFLNIVDSKIESVTETLKSETDAKYDIVIKDKEDKSATLSLTLICKDNNWKVLEKDLYVENWKVIIPKNTKLLIDGTEVSENYKTTIDLKDTYTLPAIAKSKKTFKLDNPIQSKELELTPLADNSGDEIKIELTDSALTESAFKFIKDTWNTLYAEYNKGTDVSNVQKYFSNNIDIETINKYYKTAFDSITKGSSGYKYENYNLESVIDNPNYENYVSSDEVISLNFGYKLTWNWTFSWSNEMRTMTRYSSIRLKKTADSFEIYEITDSKLFTYASQYTKDFK